MWNGCQGLDWLVLIGRSRVVRGFRSGCLYGMVFKGCIGWIGLFLLYLVQVGTNVVIRLSLLMYQLLGFYIFCLVLTLWQIAVVVVRDS